MKVALVDLPLVEDLVAIPVKELSELISTAEKFEGLFYELLAVVMRTYGKALTNDPSDKNHAALEPIRAWIHDRYIELRPTLPREVKQLYLKEIAFRVR